MRNALLLTTLGVAMVAASVGGAAGTEFPRGWWKGTIVLEERWDRITESGSGSPQSEKGTATLRITRTAPNTAAYEFGYRQETRWLGGDCPGELDSLVTASARRTAPISMAASSDRPGAYFSIKAELRVSTDGIHYTCGAYPEKYQDDWGAMYFAFTSKQPDGATSRRGTGPTDEAVFYGQFGGKPRPGGVNTSKVTWDLTLVRTAAPKAGAPVELKYSTVGAKTIPDSNLWRRGSNVQWIISDARLVDTAGVTVAKGGPSAGCDLVYFYNAYKRGKKIVTILEKGTAQGRWASEKLSCKWRLPGSGPVDSAMVNYRNVHLGIAPWVKHRGTRYWTSTSGFGPHAPHAINILVLPRVPKARAR